MSITLLLQQKIQNADYARMIQNNIASFSLAETDLLAEILSGYEFDVVQQQALVQAVMQQSRFDPDAFHQEFDDEDVTHFKINDNVFIARIASTRPCRRCVIIWCGVKRWLNRLPEYFR